MKREICVDVHYSLIAMHLKINICFDDYTFSYLLGMAGGSPNEDSSEYPTIQSPGLGQRENDTVNVAKPHTT